MTSLKVDDQNTFLAHRKIQEAMHMQKVDRDDPLSSILTVEVNTTELCNRTCVFCPRHDPQVYPNKNLNMTVKGAKLISKNLAEAGFKGKISFSGFSENLLNPNFTEIVETFRYALPDATLECNTNGDKLDHEFVTRLFDAGLDQLYINLYDGLHQIEEQFSFMKTFDQAKWKFRSHWQDHHGLILNNRSGTVEWLGLDEQEVKDLQGKPCYYPFYKMFVDWNGDVLFCSNDWRKEHVIGNIIQDSLHDVWFSKPMRKIRNRLRRGDRSGSPCDKCNVGGTLFGKKSFEIVNNYEDSNNRLIPTSIEV